MARIEIKRTYPCGTSIHYIETYGELFGNRTCFPSEECPLHGKKCVKSNKIRTKEEK